MAISTVSASDADALKASRRGGVVLLVGVAGLAIAAAVGTATLDEGVGRAEDPARVMMVTSTQSEAAAELVRKGGFEVESATLDEWGVRAGDELEVELIGELNGPQRVMRLADERGVGFVLFENSIDLREAGVHSFPNTGDTQQWRWTALGVGDFSHDESGAQSYTQGPAPRGVVMADGIGALQALFAQGRLNNQRDSLAHNPSLKELQLQERVAWGQAMVDRVSSLEELATRVQSDVDARLNEDAVQVIEVPRSEEQRLQDPHGSYSGGAVPLADGGALLVTRDVSLKSFNASTLDYALGEMLDVHRWSSSQSPGGEDSIRRLAQLKVSAHPSVRVSERGDAWVIDTRFDAPHVFGLQPGPSTEGHTGTPSFEDRGPLSGLAPDEAVVGEPYRDGRVARVAGDGASAWVRVYAPSEAKAGVEFSPIPGYTLKDLRWLDANTVVALAKAGSPANDDMIVFGRIDAPEHWYAVKGGEDWRVEGAPVYGIRMSALALSVAQAGEPASQDVVVKLESRKGYRLMRVQLLSDVEGKPDKPKADALNLLRAAVSITELDGPIPRSARGLGLWSTAAGARVVVTWMDETITGRQVFARTCTPPSDVGGGSGHDVPDASDTWICEQHQLSEGAQVRDAAARPMVGGQRVVFNSLVPVSVTESKVTRARWASLPEPERGPVPAPAPKPSSTP